MDSLRKLIYNFDGLIFLQCFTSEANGEQRELARLSKEESEKNTSETNTLRGQSSAGGRGDARGTGIVDAHPTASSCPPGSSTRFARKIRATTNTSRLNDKKLGSGISLRQKY